MVGKPCSLEPDDQVQALASSYMAMGMIIHSFILSTFSVPVTSEYRFEQHGQDPWSPGVDVLVRGKQKIKK